MTSLSTVQFPSTGRISIGDNAFSGDTILASLTTATSNLLRTPIAVTASGEVTLPSCITSVGTNAFSSTGITSLTIDNNSNLTSVGTNAFGAVTTLTYGKDSALPNNFFSAFNALTTATLTGSNITSLPGNLSNSLTTLNLESTGMTSIPNREFEGKSRLNNVTFPSMLESIGDYAFKGTALSAPNLPASVTSIGASAFENDSQLTSIGSNATGITSIGANAFKGTKLSSFTNTTNLTTIGASAFEGITQFTNVGNLTAVTSIGANAFKNTKISSVTLPTSNFTTINDGVFEGTDLATVTNTNKITSVGKDAFLNTKLTSFDAIALQTIGANAFKKTLSSSRTANTFNLTGGDKITSIGASAFENAGLSSFPSASSEGGRTGNNVLVSIGASAFKNNNLTTFTAPATLTSIGASAFENNDSLTSVDLSRTSLTSLPDNLFKTASHSGGGQTRSKRSVREGSGEQQPQPQPHGLTLKLPTTINQITGNTFANSNLKTLDLSQNTFNSPDFPAAAFMNCEDLTEVSLPKNITTVHSDTFQNTPKLSKITMPGSATRIEVNSRETAGNANSNALTTIVFNVYSENPSGTDRFANINWGQVASIMSIFAGAKDEGVTNTSPWQFNDLNSSNVNTKWTENNNITTISNSTTTATKSYNDTKWTYTKTTSTGKENESQTLAQITGKIGFFRGFSPISSGDSTGINYGRAYAFNSNASNLKQVKNIDIKINLY